MKFKISGFLIAMTLFIFACKTQKHNPSQETKADKPVNEPVEFMGNTSKIQEVKGTIANNEVPFFSWYNEKNQIEKINTFKGKVILVNFWATWCGPCQKEIPDLVRIYNQYREKGLVVLGISLDQEVSLEDLANFAGENAINYQIILDNGTLQDAFGGITAIPTTFLINKEFKIVNKSTGALDEAVLKRMIDAVI